MRISCDTPREALAAALLAFCENLELLGASGSGILDRGSGLWLLCLMVKISLVKLRVRVTRGQKPGIYSRIGWA